MNIESGIDALAYYRFLHLSEDEKLLKALNNVSVKKYLSWAFFRC
jgi:hypothetical protein